MLNTDRAKGRLLISYAHPDDESFGLGALIAKYVEMGVDVYLICTTNGDVGTVKPEMMEGYATVADLRLAELDAAAKVLRLKQVYLLGYKDSGMTGSETTNDPACLWQAPREAVARKIVEVLRDVQPHVIITFNQYGGYGHPDHIATQRATTDAYALASDPSYETGQPPYIPQKFYYSGIQTLQLRISIALMRLRGEDPRRVGRNHDIDLQAILEHIEPPHTAIDIRDYFPQWEAASACHRSQLGGGSSRLPLWLRKFIAPRQLFTRIVPAPARNRIDEHDLFEGVRLDARIPAPAMASSAAS